MAALNPAGRRSTPETVAAHKAAYAKGLAGEPAGEPETNDPALRRSYREGRKAARGEVPVRKSAQRPPSDLAGEADAFSASHTSPPKAAPSVATPSDAGMRLTRIGASSGSILLGMAAYAVAVNYVRYGMAGVKAFASAKLFNKVTPGPWAAA